MMVAYWRNHRIGHFRARVTKTMLIDIGEGECYIKGWATIAKVIIPEDYSIKSVSDIMDLIYDPAFAELFGLTGVELEETRS